MNIRSRVFNVGLGRDQNIEFLNTLTQAGSDEGKYFYVETTVDTVIDDL